MDNDLRQRDRDLAKRKRRMLIVFSPLWRGARISRSSRPASSMSSWRKSSSMRPATRRARTGRRRSTFTTRVSEPWKCQKSRHQWKNEKTVQPKLYRSLFPHDVFLSGAALPLFSFYSMLSLCSDRCKSKFRPRVQTLRMYTQLWISSTEYKITSFRVTYCRIPAELHGSTSYSGYLAGNAVKFSCIKARRRLYHRSAKTVFRYCCIIYISFSVISRSAVEV